ncbi:MAG: hypothetical protein HP492_04905 [Nitrospira sp.]|nr:hypothetical protein [Nitrospira sp.]
MTPTRSVKPLVFQDNSEWLRYVLLAGSVGMCVLVFNSFTEAERDIGTIIGGTLGALLLGFSGYVIQVRRLVIDPVRREVTVTGKSLTKSVTDRFRFDEVVKLLVLLTYDRDEELLPANRQRERWSVLFVLKDRTIPVSTNLYASKEHALREANRLQPLLHVAISDSPDEGLAHLTQTGRTVDAVTALRRQQPGMTLPQAKEIVDHATSRRTPPL